jgi:hypothetical protein
VNVTKLLMRYSGALFFFPSYVQISFEHLILVRIGFTLRARFGCSAVNTGTGCAMFVSSMTALSYAFPGISFSDVKSGTTGFAV